MQVDQRPDQEDQDRGHLHLMVEHGLGEAESYEHQTAISPQTSQGHRAEPAAFVAGGGSEHACSFSQENDRLPEDEGIRSRRQGRSGKSPVGVLHRVLTRKSEAFGTRDKILKDYSRSSLQSILNGDKSRVIVWSELYRRFPGRSLEANMDLKLKRGIYETTYGNAAYVSGPSAKSAYDLDMAERIPIEGVTSKWIRKAESSDRPGARSLD